MRLKDCEFKKSELNRDLWVDYVVDGILDFSKTTGKKDFLLKENHGQNFLCDLFKMKDKKRRFNDDETIFFFTIIRRQEKLRESVIKKTQDEEEEEE